MEVYLKINNETNEVVGVYKYSYIALTNKNKGVGLVNSIKDMWSGGKKNAFRIEVVEIIE